MRILILGGTWFLGRALATSAVAAGHEVTVFNRGRSGAAPAGVEAIRGDRESSDDLKRLAEHGPWDVVMDPSGQVPGVVLNTARALAAADRYVLVSSVSAYTGWPIDPLTEDSALLASRADAGPDFGYTDERGYPTQYGFAKAGCEQAALEVFGPDRSIILRPGVILGPWEYVGRLPWWLRRVAKGGDVLAPGDPDQLIQPIDVRDVADFAISAAQRGLAGAFNITAPSDHTTFSAFLDACRVTSGSNARFVWVSDERLARAHVRQWTELPLWRSVTTFPGTWKVSSAKAIQAGLTVRPISETTADTWGWLQDGGQAVVSDRAAELGISQERESAILAAAGTD